MKGSMCGAVIAVAAMLGGCNGAVDWMAQCVSVKPVTIVIPPGYQVAIDGEPAQVFGQSVCPRQDAAMTFVVGPSVLDDAGGCLVITPDSKFLQARILLDGTLTDEILTVVRDGNRVGLRRVGGGALLSPAPACARLPARTRIDHPLSGPPGANRSARNTTNPIDAPGSASG